jgi:hypothetical protein
MFASFSNRFNTFLLMLLVLMAAAIIAILATRSSAGPLDPPAPPASTAPLVEPRTPIRQPAAAAGFPIVISTPGSYYLAENITGVSGQFGMVIMADGVTLDLNGFALSGVPGSVYGIFGNPGLRNVSIGHGTVRGWGYDGIHGGQLSDSTYEDLRLYGNGGDGMRANGNSLISRVVATGNGGNGILMSNGGIIRDSTASNNAVDGIQALGHTLVVDNNAFSNAGAQIHAYNTGNRIDSNNVDGAGTSAINIENANNVIIRNSIQGAGSTVSIAEGNTTGPLESAKTPINNPWANIVY